MRTRVLNQLNKIITKNGLAARKMQLHHAQFRSLGKSATPFVGREFGAHAVEVDRVGAIDASQRTSIGELRDERVWARRRGHWSNPRARIVARKSVTSRISASRS